MFYARSPRWHEYTMADAFDGFFDSFFSKGDYQRSYNGAVEFKEVDEENYLLTMEVPGYNKENLEIEYLKDKQLLSVKSKDNHINKSWRLNKHTDSIEAELKDGILNVKMKKEIPAEAKPQLIAIA